MGGFHLEFSRGSAFFETDAFEDLDYANGVQFDVVAHVARAGMAVSPSGARLILGIDQNGWTFGKIHFFRLNRAEGGELGDLACESILAVDPGVQLYGG